MKNVKCNNCGGNEFKELGNGNYICTYCGTIVESERPINNIEINNYTSSEDDFGDDPYYAGGKFAEAYEMGTLKYKLADPEYAEEYERAVKHGKGEAWERENDDILSYDKKYSSLYVKMIIAMIPFLGAFLLALITHSVIMWLITIVLFFGAMVFSTICAIRRYKVMSSDTYYTALKAAKRLVDEGLATKEQMMRALDKDEELTNFRK